MCLAVPMRIEEINGMTARCTAREVERTANLALLMDRMPVVGDFVLINMGYAINIVSPEDAAASWELFDQILAVAEAPA